MSNQKTRILVAGAGYAGLLAAVRLAGKTRREAVEITLINARDVFVERLRLHQYAANQQIKRRPIVDVLRGSGVAFFQGAITAIDLARRAVVVQTLVGSSRVDYDYLLYTLGSTIERNGVPGVREFAYTLSLDGPRSTETLRSALPALNMRGGCMVVVGGGATGIETAAEFAEAYPKLNISLVTSGELAAFLGPQVQPHIVVTLQRLGVTICDNTRITRVDAGTLICADGAAMTYDLCVWAGGFSVPALAREAGLAINERGQVLIDPFMRSVSHPEVYAAGDCAFPVERPGAPVRMAAYTAALMGAHAADCLSNALAGRPQKPLSFAYAGQGISLGRRDAVGFGNYPDDKPNPPIFTGRTAVGIREFFVNFLASAASIERRWPGFFYWLGKRRVRAAPTHATQPTEQQSGLSVQ